MGGLIIRLSRTEAELLSTIIMRPLTSSSQLIEVLWPDPDLEPENARNTIAVYIYKLRSKGIPVGNRIGLGYEIDPNYFARPS